MNRNFHFDQMRVISCFMVIAIHVCNIYNRAFPDLSQFDYVVAALVNSCSRISVPIFFMVSGALLAGRAPDVTKSLQRFKKYLLITVVWCVFYGIWSSTYLQKDYDFHDILTTPTSKHLWFLYALLALYLALPLIQTMMRNLSEKMQSYLLILFAVSVFGGYILDFLSIPVQYPIAVIAENQYFGFFILGYILHQKQDKIQIKTGHLWGIFSACCIIVTVCTAILSFSKHSHEDVLFQYRNPLLVFASISAFILMERLPAGEIHKLWTKFVHHVSDNSFGIYVFHAVFLNVLNQELNMVSLSAWIGVPLFTILIFIATDICVIFARKIPYLREFF